MINKRLTTAEAAARLGVKPATLYAYVSRGLLEPERGPAGSTFDVVEVARLAATARRPQGGRGGGSRRTRDGTRGTVPDPVFVTELSLISEGRLSYRGLDAVGLSREWSFERVAEWLWTPAQSRDGAEGWSLPSPMADALRRALEPLPDSASILERFMAAVVAASLCDDLRHDLSPAGVSVTGRRLLAALVAALPLDGRERSGDSDRRMSMAESVWRGLTRRRPAAASVAAVDAALVLAADHELAPSTLAARVAASFRADPYAVVLTGLGPASGTWRPGSTGAPSEVERLLERAGEVGAERAVGERLRRDGDVPHGFGMPLYPGGDPRAAELLSRLERVGPPRRLAVVRELIEVGRSRGFAPANFDLGLGALSYCAEMVPGSGQAISTLAKAAGWVAHAMEEYERPTRFRSRADYVGVPPAASSGS